MARWLILVVLLVSCGRTAPAVAPTAVPTPVAMPIPTETAAPTAIPEPTAAPTDVPATATPAPTRTAAPTFTPAPTLTPQPTAVPEPSQGLGLLQANWEARAGVATKKGIIGTVYANGFEAVFQNDRVWYLSRQLTEATALTPDDIYTLGKTVMPDDAVLVKTYTRDVTTVHLYQSKWLADQFDADMFIEGQPGQFTLQYNVYDGKATSVLLALGNNP